jgi:hypothetical protein
MRKRDFEILKSLEKFKCLTTSQIAALHFSNNANPKITANRVLKRLRLNQVITANTDRAFQEYIYFPSNSTIKKDSQKLDHYLLMNQTIIDMLIYSSIQEYHFETTIPDADFIPDIYVKGWLSNDWFIECQNSLYTTKQLYSKLDKYKKFHEKGYWNNERVMIIGKVNLKFDPDDYPFKVRQVRVINDLKDTILKLKEIKLQEFKTSQKVIIPNSQVIKSSNGEIKFVL